MQPRDIELPDIAAGRRRGPRVHRSRKWIAGARSVQYGNYEGRSLVLTQRDATHFDFRFEPLHPHIATIVVRDVDISLMTPSLPAWTRSDAGLRRIALTDRQWNRQE